MTEGPWVLQSFPLNCTLKRVPGIEKKDSCDEVLTVPPVTFLVDLSLLNQFLVVWC